MKENITSAKKIRDNMVSWNEVGELLLREFRDKKENKSIRAIGCKIELVNKLYNCNLRIDKRLVAK